MALSLVEEAGEDETMYRSVLRTGSQVMQVWVEETKSMRIDSWLIGPGATFSREGEKDAVRDIEKGE